MRPPCSSVPIAAIAACLLSTASLAQTAPGETEAETPAPAPAAAGEEWTQEAEKLDSLYFGGDNLAKRDDAVRLADESAAKYPSSYAIQWRAARAVWYAGEPLDDDKDSDKLEDLGARARKYAQKALALKPDGIEAHFFNGLAIGTYARGISIITALAKGLGGKFEEEMNWVVGKDPRFSEGGAYRALGRYWWKLPWPKYDYEKSLDLLRKALDVEGRKMRTHLYLADTFAALDRKGEAKKEYEWVLSAQPESFDLAEAPFMRQEAKKGLAELK